MTLVLLLSCSFPALAQNDSIADGKEAKKKKERSVQLVGEVYDSFTKVPVKAFLTLMRADSTVVDTTTCQVWGTSTYYSFRVPAVQQQYIIKATYEGYEDTFLNYPLRHIARNNYFELPRLLMKKRQGDIWRENDLDGVVVTGTRVKIAYRGDTIVYNASAFNLPEGSMLDGLIRQMPGAELKDNGDIYINGKKVDYLTLNGKDFFKGQNKVMLDNLPYYTVRDIKVYNKSTRQSELVGRDLGKKDYVMDVQLKREYNRGFMGNLEVAGGTDDRYLARLFGLYYSDHTRISLFGNTNNVNEIRRPGGEGEWTPSQRPQGLRTTRHTGFHLDTEDQDKIWNEVVDATLVSSHTENWSRTSTERFAAAGNIFGGSESWSTQKDFNFHLSNEFSSKKPFSIFTEVGLDYGNGRRDSHSQDSTWQQSPINQTLNLDLNKYRTVQFYVRTFTEHKFSWGDAFSITANVNYNRTRPSDNFTRTDTRYAQGLNDDLRHKYNDTRQHDYSYNVEANYMLSMLNYWYIGPRIIYRQRLNDNRNDLFRLDWLNATDSDPHEIGWLPSSRSQLMSVIDPDNSTHEQLFTRQYTGEMVAYRTKEGRYFHISLPVNHHVERLRYDDHHTDTVAHRSYTLFAPSVMYYRWGSGNGLEYIAYNMDMSRPSFTSLMPHDNTSNPLATWVSNPGLKTRVNHTLSMAFGFNNDSIRRFSRLWGSLNLTRNSWGTRTTYNSKSGAYVYQSDNINGNWNASLGNSYQRPVDRKKRLLLKHEARADYTHSVDFPIIDMASAASGQASKSVVNNWVLGEKLELEYQKDKLTASVLGNVNWRSSTSDREAFERISAFDFTYGARLLYTVPWVKLSLGTDLKMYSRRGYGSAMMNTDDLVWNLEVSRPLLKEKLMVKVAAFDLLHQLSNKQYSVNAQGRTETWNNCIPRYVMAHLIWRFNHQPKKK